MRTVRHRAWRTRRGCCSGFEADRIERHHRARADDQSLLRYLDRDVLRRSRVSAFPCPRYQRPAKIRIDEVEVIESAMQMRQLRLVLAWAELHQDELLESWQRARAGETLLSIEPLR